MSGTSGFIPVFVRNTDSSNVYIPIQLNYLLTDIEMGIFENLNSNNTIHCHFGIAKIIFNYSDSITEGATEEIRIYAFRVVPKSVNSSSWQ